MVEDRYTPVRELGAGGMGAVWLYTDTLLDRPVAVKFLQVTDQQMYKDLFLSEARTLASLQHPNITMIYDAVFNEAENRFYIMMEYVEGKSLGDLIENSIGSLLLETVFDVTVGVLEALKYAHNRGLVHRDIKPDNIVIERGGVKLTDFGLAALASILAEDKTDYIFGTPAYMPPEQIISEGMDGRADLYAFGVTLFEMLTDGRLPFEYEDKNDLLKAHVEEPPPSVREFAPNVPLVLDRIVDKLLAKHPDDRYPSAEAVLDVFKSLQAREKFGERYSQVLDPNAKPLVGRQKELKKIEALWTETQVTNKSQLLVVRGNLGIGKTRLIAEFLGNSVIDKNQVALVGRCNELGAPYTPYAEVLAAIFDRGLVKPSSLESQMDRVLEQVPGLAALLNIEEPPKPEQEVPQPTSSGLWQTLSTRVPAGNVPTDPLQTQWQFFATVLNILVELGPTVIFLNAAALMDESSVALTRFLIQQGQLPLLLIVECQDEGKPIAWLDTFTSDEKDELVLSALSSIEMKQYLADFLEGPISGAVVTIVEKRSRGNPLHLEELIRQLIDLGDVFQSEDGEWRYKPPEETDDLSQDLISPFLQNAFTRRLEKLSEKSREVLARAAILEPGPEFDFDIWLALLGGDSQLPVAEEALKEALDRRLLRDIGDNHYSFRPVDVSKALVATITSERQRDLHRQAAEVLIDKQGDPMLIGYHFEQAGMATESAEHLEAAGARAMAANAINQAISCYNHAVELVETASGYAALGNLYRQRGAWADSIDAFQRAFELAKDSGNADVQAHTLNELAFTLWLSDEYKMAAQSASAALKLKGASIIEHATAQSHLGMISWGLGHLREAEKWCRKSVDMLIGSGNETKLAAAYNRLGLVYFSLGRFTEAVQVTNLSLEIRKRLQDYWGQGYCLVSLGKVSTAQGNFEKAIFYFDSAQQLFEKIGSNDGLMVVFTEQGRIMINQGQAGESLPVLGQAMKLAQELGKGNSYNLGDIYLLIAQASLAENQVERAQASVDNALKLVEAAGNQEYIAAGWIVLAQIQAAEDKPDLAEQTYQKAVSLFEKVGSPAGLLRTKLNYARLLADQGQTDRAAAMEQDTRSQAAGIGLYL